MEDSTEKATCCCRRCGQNLDSSANFCSRCGSSQQKRPCLQLRHWLLIVTGSSILSYAVISLQPWFQGTPPKGSLSKEHAGSAEAPVSPADLDGLFAQAEQNLRKIAESSEPDSAVTLETIDTLSKILRIEPGNSWALLQMAELSFEQRIFDKSCDFYARYLQSAPEDLAVRTRYASALTFSGKASQAVDELNKVLAQEPGNFQALAFLAIARYELGEKDQAKLDLAKAVSLAPNDEAKARLNKFADSLSAKEAQGANSSGASLDQNNKRGASGPFAGLDLFLRQHPIAGPKYKGLQLVGTDIRISMADFPMDKMPPFVKDKFSANAKAEALKESAGKPYDLVFLDSSSGAEMLRMKLQP